MNNSLSKVDFEDVVKLSAGQLADLLGKTDDNALAMALKGASPDAAKCVYGGMSVDRQEKVRAEMERLGSVRLSDVEEAQEKIAAVIRGL